jgi:hypothetical protein
VNNADAPALFRLGAAQEPTMEQQSVPGNLNGEAVRESDITGKPVPGEVRTVTGDELAEAAGGGGNATGKGRAGEGSTLAGADAGGHQGDDDLGRGGD